ncbi:hypothetical protein [Streptacidiphilus fuscans]|uniref:hypothetical protein n=1 Tax=Streptacidiphilus fuscans TaxID=2789292 RepID=UPI0018ACE462|nr:hypothetical protein [Streptacidiphilus fuscans]
MAGSPDVLPAHCGAGRAADLAGALAQPLLDSARRPAPSDRLVWSCTVQQSPGEAALTDEQWARVALRVLAAAGLLTRTDPSTGCPWVAIRTRDPHRLVVLATLIRPDGSRPDLDHTATRVRAVLQLLTFSPQLTRAAAPSAPPAWARTGTRRSR